MSLPTCTTSFPRADVGAGVYGFQPVQPQVPPQQAAFDPVVVNQVTRLGMQLREFVSACDSTLVDLNSAYRTEVADAQTDNWSLFGHFVTRSSYEKNHAVANKVDALKQHALSINQGLMSFGNPGIFLNTDLDGNSIRIAENSEHSFLANWFTSNTYSSYASHDTMDQLSMTSEKVRRVRNQAENAIFSLSYLTQSCRPFFASKL